MHDDQNSEGLLGSLEETKESKVLHLYVCRTLFKINYEQDLVHDLNSNVAKMWTSSDTYNSCLHRCSSVLFEYGDSQNQDGVIYRL